MKLDFRLKNGATGGSIIDNDGADSAIRALRETYSDRIDWRAMHDKYRDHPALTETARATLARLAGFREAA